MAAAGLARQCRWCDALAGSTQLNCTCNTESRTHVHVNTPLPCKLVPCYACGARRAQCSHRTCTTPTAASAALAQPVTTQYTWSTSSRRSRTCGEHCAANSHHCLDCAAHQLTHTDSPWVNLWRAIERLSDLPSAPVQTALWHSIGPAAATPLSYPPGDAVHMWHRLIQSSGPYSESCMAAAVASQHAPQHSIPVGSQAALHRLAVRITMWCKAEWLSSNQHAARWQADCGVNPAKQPLLLPFHCMLLT
jgi:hypothetical protein